MMYTAPGNTKIALSAAASQDDLLVFAYSQPRKHQEVLAALSGSSNHG